MAELEHLKVDELHELHELEHNARRIALVTAIFGVMLAITSLGGSNAMKEMLLSQQQASDQWAYYQAKSIREHIYKTQTMLLDAQMTERGAAMNPEAKAKYEAALNKMVEEAGRYGLEKKEIEKEARKLEHERDIHRKNNPYFEFAEVFLQIAIVMSSVSILATSRPVFYLAIGLATLGAVLSFNGFFMVIDVPFLSH